MQSFVLGDKKSVAHVQLATLMTTSVPCKQSWYRVIATEVKVHTGLSFKNNCFARLCLLFYLYYVYFFYFIFSMYY